jgi:energy-coupling factor transporter ATP-binding protein EcfA2
LEETRAEKARSDAIDRDIFEDSKRYKKECKVLVLGTSESGKSTIIKQMKIIQGGYDERERNEYRMAIYKNVLDCVGMLARVVRRAGISSLPENLWEYAEVLLIAFPAPGGDEAHAESNEETEMESAESGSWITAMDSVDPVPFADAESNAEAEMESVESGSWITAIESVDVDIDPAPFMDVESNIGTEIESVESGSWITAFGSVDMVPRSDSEYHGGMLLGRVGSKRLGTSDILAQTHAVLTPALVDAVWNIWCSCTEERAADEHLAEFNLMDSSR